MTDLKSFARRIDSLEEEKKNLSEDIRSVYAEAKSAGYDVKAVREARRRLKLTPEFEAVVETYQLELDLKPSGKASAKRERAEARSAGA